MTSLSAFCPNQIGPTIRSKIGPNNTLNVNNGVKGKPGGLDGRDQSRLIETLSRSSRLTFENRRDFLDGRD